MLVIALAAGVAALEAALAFRTGAVGVPGLFLVRFADESDGAGAPPNAESADGGESVIAKLPDRTATPKHAPEEATGSVSPSGGEPTLKGLAEIPLKPWLEEEKKEEGSAPADSKVKTGGLQAREELPWDAVEPVPFESSGTRAPSEQRSAAPATPPAPALARLPAESEVAAWVKAKATEIKGADRARPLYHFEFWLEPPEAVRANLATVTYEFNTPAVMPQSQMSREVKTGFRVSAGGLVCADKVTVTLRFKDGRSQRVEVDGCKLVT
jgi:hypothetical protein